MKQTKNRIWNLEFRIWNRLHSIFKILYSKFKPKGFTPAPTFKIGHNYFFSVISQNIFKCIFLHKRKLVRGFTLIEVSLSMAFLLIIFAMSAPYYQTFQVRNNLDIAQNTIVQSLRRAQLLSQAGDGDMNWGVYVQVGSIIVFKGPSYVLRDVNYDEVFDLPASVVSSGIAEVVFSKLYGLPQSIGTFTLTSTANETRNITINEKGMVNF